MKGAKGHSIPTRHNPERSVKRKELNPKLPNDEFDDIESLKSTSNWKEIQSSTDQGLIENENPSSDMPSQYHIKTTDPISVLHTLLFCFENHNRASQWTVECQEDAVLVKMKDQNPNEKKLKLWREFDPDQAFRKYERQILLQDSQDEGSEGFNDQASVFSGSSPPHEDVQEDDIVETKNLEEAISKYKPFQEASDKKGSLSMSVESTTDGRIYKTFAVFNAKRGGRIKVKASGGMIEQLKSINTTKMTDIQLGLYIAKRDPKYSHIAPYFTAKMFEMF